MGVPKWSVKLAHSGEVVFRPVHVDNISLTEKRPGIVPASMPAPVNAVVLNSLSKAFIINRANGKMIRQIDLDFPANSGGTADNIFFYCGSTNGRYYCIRMQDEINTWTLATGNQITAPIELYQGRIYVASEDRNFYSAENGREVWHVSLHSPIVAPFGVDSKGVFVPCEDGNLYALRPDGTKLWDPVQFNYPLRPGVQVGGTPSSRPTPAALSAPSTSETARFAGRRRAPKMALAIFGTDVCLLNHGQLVIVDEMMGKQKISLELSGLDRFVASTGSTAIYVANSGGDVFCIRQMSAGYLTPDMLHAPAQPKQTGPVIKKKEAPAGGAAAPAAPAAP